MDRRDLILEHDRLFHMAEDGAWDNIREHGLLSTKALVDRYEPDQGTREQILGRRRLKSIELNRSGMPTAWVRDQMPLRDLADKMTPGTTPEQFLDALNGRVFFWLTWDRLLGLLTARPYRNIPHIVLTVRTRQLLDKYESQTTLAGLNTGTINKPNHPARGPEIFEPIDSYAMRRPTGVGNSTRPTPPVELTIANAVPDIVDFTESVERWRGDDLLETIYLNRRAT